MKLLATNDDGLLAPGIKILVDTLVNIGEVKIVAPVTEQSGMGHAISVNRPLRLHKMSIHNQVKTSYMLDGTPADCVKMAVSGLDIQPDLVVSGINLGANIGTDVIYSGTVSAAIESVMLGIPAIAVSLASFSPEYLGTAAHYVEKILCDIGLSQLNKLVPPHALLNINVPGLPIDEVKGVKVTQLCNKSFDNEVIKREDPRGNHYYWMGGAKPKLTSHDLGIDSVAVAHGYVSITPIHFDLTYHGLIEQLKPKIER